MAQSLNAHRWHTIIKILEGTFKDTVHCVQKGYGSDFQPQKVELLPTAMKILAMTCLVGLVGEYHSHLCE